MTLDSARPHSSTSRQLLELVVQTRQEYADFLRAVASCERLADDLEKGRLLERCDIAMKEWQHAHSAWEKNSKVS
ncbi:MAG: hypothetical protein C0621_10035 [Desulfuromonas sp.]|nr:MAG: hypothetical protein C0621_10035 [Desulfuromonas sp.]